MTTATATEIPTQWRDLVENLYDLRPIRSKATHLKAAAQVDKLIGLKKMTKDQKDYLDALVALIVQYESDRYPKPGPDPIGNLKFLMEQNGMTASDLGRLLGNRSKGTQILNGHRGMSKATIEKLCTRFKVGPAVFFPNMYQPS